MRNFFKVFLIIGGTFSVILGVIGIFLPVLPTTPFILLAAVCYTRSSERFYKWLVDNRWIGAYIHNYRNGRGMPKTQKILSLLALWLTISASAFFVVSHWWLRAVLFFIALGVSTHIHRLKTYKMEDLTKIQAALLNNTIIGEKE